MQAACDKSVLGRLDALENNLAETCSQRATAVNVRMALAALGEPTTSPEAAVADWRRPQMGEEGRGYPPSLPKRSRSCKPCPWPQPQGGGDTPKGASDSGDSKGEDEDDVEQYSLKVPGQGPKPRVARHVAPAALHHQLIALPMVAQM